MKLRALTLKEASNGDNYLKCDFAASNNKYAKPISTNVFNNGSDEYVFNALCGDFGIDTVDELKIIDCKEDFKGHIFTADVTPHYVVDTKGDIVTRSVKNSKGKTVEEKVISTTLTSIVIEDWNQTEEQVINRFERSWAKQDLIVPTEDEEQLKWCEKPHHLTFWHQHQPSISHFI